MQVRVGGLALLHTFSAISGVYVKSIKYEKINNIYVTHGGHWFDEHNSDDLQRLEILKQRSVCRNMYANMIKVWTISDLKKRDIAIENNLNYLVFWDNDLTDFMKWCDSFDEIHVLKQF